MANPNRPSLVWRLGCASLLAACAGHVALGGRLQRPPQLVGEWIDVRHTTLSDTALWVLRDNGYDGSARIVVTTDPDGATTVSRTERRFGSWYFSGSLSDTAQRALCFARRLGRDGPSCLAFALDTTTVDHNQRRRLTIRGYQGEHHTGDRVLIEHGPSR